MAETPARTLYYLDRDADSFPSFVDSLRACCAHVEIFSSIEALLSALTEREPGVVLMDLQDLQGSPTSHTNQLLELRGRVPMGLVSACSLEGCIGDLRKWGLLQVAVKVPPCTDLEVRHFIEMVEDARNGFGLIGYLGDTVEMYSVAIRTIPEKHAAIERAVNHFATCGFNVHELYDVRLTLEELANNALFHAFQTETGAEKYSIRGFTQLEDGESVRIEYGSDGLVAGFSVTDNAGTLATRTILNKLERQLNREGLYDESGRGIYLTRMLSSQYVINIERGKRTQSVVLFDERRKSDRPKPFLVNRVGFDDFDEWRIDPDFD